MSTLNALMEVEFPMLIRFGTTQMLLQNILSLTEGSVISFPRSPEEPAELVVNGRVVARGTLVSAKGNYAVRITEVVENP
ncbi:MAG: hypothetical protein C5B51_00720 [Terriglobia bacterium]|nr:MAG: hypothetical protein C5B51_00720 [Terriglobia bacterium]